MTVHEDAEQAIAVLRHVVDAYDEGVEIEFKPRECWDALAALARLLALLNTQTEALEREQERA